MRKHGKRTEKALCSLAQGETSLLQSPICMLRDNCLWLTCLHADYWCRKDQLQIKILLSISISLSLSLRVCLCTCSVEMKTTKAEQLCVLDISSPYFASIVYSIELWQTAGQSMITQWAATYLSICSELSEESAFMNRVPSIVYWGLYSL